MNIKIKNGERELICSLEDGPTSRSLLAQLPLDVPVDNFGGKEKIFYPRRLDLTGANLADARAGSVCYYEPWGNVALFYQDFGPGQGLYQLGQVIEGQEYLSQLEGRITIEAPLT